MGVDIGEILIKEEIELHKLSSKIIAIDGNNTLYQFLAIIRGPDGKPLMNRKGQVTSHLSGILYRTCNLLSSNIWPVYIFDGQPPSFKTKEIYERSERREEAQRKYELALKKGDLEEARKFAQAAARINDQILSSGKELLQLMGIPFIDAPSEGEAQAAYLARRGLVYAAGSQDYDAALFGAPLIVRNLTITGKRKLPGKKTFIEVKPEIVNVEISLRELGISLEKLIEIAMIVGTDFTQGIKGIGPKKALNLIKQGLSVDEIYSQMGLKKPEDFEEIKQFFLNPPFKEIKGINFEEPDMERIVSYLVDRHDFSEERVRKALEPAILSFKRRESGLSRFFG